MNRLNDFFSSENFRWMKFDSALILFIVFLFSCAQKSNDHSLCDSLSNQKININPDTLENPIIPDTAEKGPVKKVVVKEDTVTHYPRGKNIFYFQTYKYELTGKLSKETFYDDSKKTFYMLNLDQGINVIIRPGEENLPLHDFDALTYVVKKLE